MKISRRHYSNNKILYLKNNSSDIDEELKITTSDGVVIQSLSNVIVDGFFKKYCTVPFIYDLVVIIYSYANDFNIYKIYPSVLGNELIIEHKKTIRNDRSYRTAYSFADGIEYDIHKSYNTGIELIECESINDKKEADIYTELSLTCNDPTFFGEIWKLSPLSTSWYIKNKRSVIERRS